MANLIIDLSKNNGSVDFQKLAKAGVKGVFLKATEGETYVDSTFFARRKAAQAAGLHVGAYHFARQDLHADPYISAKEFVKVIGHPGQNDFRPALDFETHSPKLSAAAQVQWARDFNQIVKKSIGVLPLFYSYSAFIQSLGASKPIGAGLWLATYGRNDGVEHPFVAPAPWRKSVAHQFSSRCTIVGCSGLVDLNTAASLTPLLVHVPAHKKVTQWILKHRHFHNSGVDTYIETEESK